MTTDETSPAYSVLKHEDHYNVCNRSGRIIMTCGDAASAAHYASLLQEAYAAGYKRGYSDCGKA